MTDDEAIAIHIAAVRERGEGEISHGCARAIAAQYHSGQASAGYAFVSTGAITTEDSGDLWRELTDDYKLYNQGSPAERTALDCLGTYLVDRSVRGETGPVGGWSDMWVR